MLAEIALAALLDSASVATPAAKETIYVMQVQPQAAPATMSEGKSDAAKYVVGGLMAGLGTYLIIHGTNNPTVKVTVPDNGPITAERSTNGQVYLGFATVALAVIILAVK